MNRLSKKRYPLKPIRRIHSSQSQRDGQTAESNLDLWLRRISNFSQVGLFALTLWALYYTVIPLYQKAVLEEAIAQRELTLRDLEKSAENLYRRVRRYAVQQFVFSAGAECTGLLIPPQSDDGAPPGPVWEEVLNTDVNSCLHKVLERSADLKELRKQDLEYLSEQIRQMSHEFELDRRNALRDYQDLPGKAAKDPTILKPLKGVRRAVLSVLPINTDKRDAVEFRYKVEQAQFEIVGEYAARVRKEISTLYSPKWPDGK